MFYTITCDYAHQSITFSSPERPDCPLCVALERFFRLEQDLAESQREVTALRDELQGHIEPEVD